MADAVLIAAHQGATVVTANQRSARELRERFDRRQQDQGLVLWRTPDVLPWTAWMMRFWNALVFRGAASETLLNGLQHDAVWQRVLAESAYSGGLLGLAATAQRAGEAWELLHQYQVPLDPQAFSQRPEWSAFFDWARSFAAICREAGWIDEACLPDAVASALESERLTVPTRVLLFGFDHLTPQQERFVTVLRQVGCDCAIVGLPFTAAGASLLPLKDSTAELWAAAAWARATLEGAPGPSRIGIIVPNLEGLRCKVEDVFLKVFHPGQVPVTAERCAPAFEISLGTPLAENPVVAIALLALKLACGSVTLTEAGRLLRSPFLGGAETEMTLRARADARLRDAGRLQITIALLAQVAQDCGCPVLCSSLDRLQDRGASLAGPQSPSDWSGTASEVLAAMGWPGQRRLNSAEFQAVEAWHDLLAHFAGLRVVEPLMDAARFLSALERCASLRTFEAEKHGAPVQVMGMLEAAGSRFDRLWVAGLHDGAWPAGVKPTPFIPYSLQLLHQLPHASAAVELEFARRITDRLLRSAREVVLSYPEHDEHAELRPSPLLATVPYCSDKLILVQPESWQERMFNSAPMESLIDESGPPLVEGARVPGGTGTLRQQSLCPFSAFAQMRLGARALELPQPGLSAAERGNLIHRAAELFWKQVRSWEGLMSRQAELKELLTQSVDLAMLDFELDGKAAWEREVARLERERVVDLLLQLLEQEKRRAAFLVLDSEQRRTVTLGGMRFEVKVDRVDEVAGRGRVIIDYKTGQMKFTAWEGRRPEEPQLPIYAATTGERIAAVALAKVRAGEVGFQGYVPDSLLIPDANPFSRTNPGAAHMTLAQVIDEWKQTVERLAREYRAGEAQADPIDPRETCKYCPLPSLCRIAEAQPGPDLERGDAE